MRLEKIPCQSGGVHIRTLYTTMKDRNLIILLLILSIILLCPIITKKVDPFDEGLILAGAERIQNGQIPFNEFWTIYPPGQTYLLAFLFDTFGSSLITARVYDLIIKALLAVSAFFVVLKITIQKQIALLSWIMSIAWLVGSSNSLYTIFPSILLIFIGVIFLLFHFDKEDYLSLIFCGISLTLSALFRHDLATYGAVPILLVLTLKTLQQKPLNWTYILCYLASFLILGLPILVFIWVKIDIKEIIQQLIILPIEIMPNFRSTPYPDLSITNKLFYFFPFVAICGFIFTTTKIIKAKEIKIQYYGIWVVSLIGICFLNQVLARSDVAHLTPLALINMMLVPVIFFLGYKQLKGHLRFLCLLFFSLFVIYILRIPVTWKDQYQIDEFIEYNGKPIVARAGRIALPDQLEQTIHFIQNHTKSNEEIYVGVKNHDQFIVNKPIIYYLSNRGYPTKFHQLDPGVTNTTAAQEQIVKDLESSAVTKIVLTTSYWYEENYTKYDLNINIVDEYIRKNYQFEKNFGDYEIWKKLSNS